MRLAVLLWLAAAMTLAAAPSLARAAPTSLKLGTQTLTQCSSSPLAYCGELPVPLDYSSPAGPDIEIAYRWYPATEGEAQGTVLPVEGGPGYPSIESVDYGSGSGEAGYRPMYGPLLEHFNMLAVDNRGTGLSAPLRCPALQEYDGATGAAAFQETVGECAASLNHRYRYPDGGYVHASDLFTSAPAAADMAAIIEALGIGKVDLYGDSYGSYFAQVFASRYPQLLRSVVLDSTYETIGLEPWYLGSIESMPANFEKACTRAPACADAETEPVWSRIAELAERLRAQPVSATVPGPSGKREKVSMGVVGLVDLVNDASEDRQVYRDLDAAARALLEEDEAAPLLRLYAQRLAVDEAYFGLPVKEYSVELYFAVGCLDYPQLFSMDASPQQRAQELNAAEQQLPAATFSPFSTEEWLSQDENTEAYTGCLDWPAPTSFQPPIEKKPPLLGSSLPVLVLGGELDDWTPPKDVPGKVLGYLGGDTRFVELANSTHVVGEGETNCGSQLIRSFVEAPSQLQSLDVSCAPAVASIHSVGRYAGSLSAQMPLSVAAGSTASQAALEMASAAVQTAGDAIARFQATEADVDHGLYGGKVSVSSRGRKLTLEHDRLVPGVSVSGTVTLTPASSIEDGEVALADLTVATAGVKPETLIATWTTSGSGAVAKVLGSQAGVAVVGTTPAP